MSLTRRIFFVVMAVAASAWALMVFAAQYVELKYREETAAIAEGKATLTQKNIEAALADYEAVMAFVPCNPQLYKEVLLFLTYGVDLSLKAPYAEGSEEYLARAVQTLKDQLACTPTDGKAWLDLAVINTHSEGFTKRSEAALLMSRRVAPEESWLAQKRLAFALRVLPLLSPAARKELKRDIATLTRAHPNRLNIILNRAGLHSAEELEAYFVPAAKAPQPEEEVAP